MAISASHIYCYVAGTRFESNMAHVVGWCVTVIYYSFNDRRVSRGRVITFPFEKLAKEVNGRLSAWSRACTMTRARARTHTHARTHTNAHTHTQLNVSLTCGNHRRHETLSRVE